MCFDLQFAVWDQYISEILVYSQVFFPLIIDKWCFETAGEESSDLPRPIYKKKFTFWVSAYFVLPAFGFTSFVKEMTDGSITTCL